MDYLFTSTQIIGTNIRLACFFNWHANFKCLNILKHPVVLKFQIYRLIICSFNNNNNEINQSELAYFLYFRLRLINLSRVLFEFTG